MRPCLVGLLAFFAFSHPFATSADPAPAISVSGGIQLGGALQPLVFTWDTQMAVQGSGWRAGESISISLSGPLNSPGVSPADIALDTVTADASGAFVSSVAIPYDRGVTGPQANIPHPGLYAVRATGGSGTVSAAARINLAPATYTGTGGTIDWSRERGSRDGILPGPLRGYSPERADPEWISVWDNRPVEAYGTILSGDAAGGDQPAHISREDDPITHYGHDTNIFLTPDPQYRWLIGTANYFANQAESDAEAGLARIEVEWEALNNGNTKTYGAGRIGMPAWAMPTADDRVYVVGRWILDAGHPEIGDRTEIHPPRLMAVMRRRPAVSSGQTAAAQVDIYVSGHGGGANQYPSGMEAALSQGGRGGGRIRDVLGANDQQVYYRAGPLSTFEFPLVNLLVQQLAGAALDGPIYVTAGPSAFCWSTPAPEEQPVNDMDYDFDVVLPSAPDGATSVSVEAVTQPQHTTSVGEIITYPNAANGLPAIAHVHLPYNGADSGIYARTLKFTWNTAAAPQHHFHVTLNRITPLANPGDWRMWSDVSGQWTYLTAAAPGLSQTAQGQAVAIPNAAYDVYLRDTDTLRVLVQGYRAQCIDGLFGTLFGKSSYEAGVQLLVNCGPNNNDDLGGAFLELPALPSSAGNYTVIADAPGQTGGGAFQVDLTVDYLSPVQVSPECQGRGALAPSINPNGVVGAGLSIPPVVNISPDALVTAFGQNFAPAGTARVLADADVRDGQLPTSVSCTCVEVNHRLTPLLYVSSASINFQIPDLAQEGNLTVQVISNCGAPNQKASVPVTVAAQPVAPGFFFFIQNLSGKNPIAARNAVTGAPIGSPGLLPGVTFTPAHPGDFVSLYMTGLGLTDPPLLGGAIARQASSTVFPVSVTLNGNQLADSDVLYAGIAPNYAGLFQVNIRIPDNAPNGDLAVSLTIDGVSTPAGAFLTVQR